MPRFQDMLRAKRVFGGGDTGRRPLGMPEPDNESFEQMFRQIHPMVNMLKMEDTNRQKDMANFELSLRQREQGQIGAIGGRPAAPMRPNKQTVFGGVQPLTSMQQKFRADDLAATAQKDRMALQAGSLNNTLASGAQRNEADMARTVAEINGRADVARSNKESVERAANDARTDKAKTDEIARTQKGPIINTPDPKDPTKMIATRHNPVTNKLERVQVDDDQAGTAYRPGNIPKPTVNAGQDPVKLAALRKTTQGTLDELDELLDPKSDTLRSHAADATGASGMLGQLSEWTHTSALTPETTRGRAGIKALRGKLVLNLIGEMKSQSKTGATGFGALNQRELAVLEDSASKLNPNLSDEAFAAELRKIRKQLQMIMQDAADGGAPSGGGPSGGSSDADKRAEDYMRRKGLM